MAEKENQEKQKPGVGPHTRFLRSLDVPTDRLNAYALGCVADAIEGCGLAYQEHQKMIRDLVGGLIQQLPGYLGNHVPELAEEEEPIQ